MTSFAVFVTIVLGHQRRRPRGFAEDVPYFKGKLPQGAFRRVRSLRTYYVFNVDRELGDFLKELRPLASKQQYKEQKLQGGKIRFVQPEALQKKTGKFYEIVIEKDKHVKVAKTGERDSDYEPSKGLLATVAVEYLKK